MSTNCRAWLVVFLLQLALDVALKCSEGCYEIAHENSRQGSSDWWYPQSDCDPIIEGFTSPQFSYLPGQKIEFKMTKQQHVSKYSLSIYRLGYYNGRGARRIGFANIFNYNEQPPCLFEEASRMVDCQNWHVSATWTIPFNLTSGVFIALPVATVISNITQASTNCTNLHGSYIPFVIRREFHASAHKFGSDVLFKTSDLTWVAYNKYGSWNLYRGNGSFDFASRASRVSYNRPFSNRLVAPKGQHQNFLFGTEYAMLRWLEKHGYDVSYASCFDVEEYDRQDVIAGNFKSLLSVGHDEYYTQELRDAFENSRNKGVNLAFFSGNEVFWKVRYDVSSNYQSSVNTSTNNSIPRFANQLLAINSSIYFTSTDGKLLTVASYPFQQRLKNESFSIASPRQLSQLNSSTNTSTVLNSELSNSTVLSVVASKSQSPPQRHVQQPRIVICLKESIDQGRTAAGSREILDSSHITSEADWTGTFMDTRRHPNKPQNSLTGQLFMVNAMRRDSLTVTREEGKLRFWRDSPQVSVMQSLDYTTAPGVLGYEWDIWSDDQHRPAGLIGLSTSVYRVRHALLQDYGASYKGSGTVTHRVSLYRQVINASYGENNFATPDMNINPASAKVDSALATFLKASWSCNVRQRHPLLQSSLVFGAGTVQWPWALSSIHDGDVLPVDFNLQQATVNLLADMGVQPKKLRIQSSLEVVDTASPDKPAVKSLESNDAARRLSAVAAGAAAVPAEHQLLRAVPSLDYEPPVSVILTPTQNQVFDIRAAPEDTKKPRFNTTTSYGATTSNSTASSTNMSSVSALVSPAHDKTATRETTGRLHKARTPVMRQWSSWSLSSIAAAMSSSSSLSQAASVVKSSTALPLPVTPAPASSDPNAGAVIFTADNRRMLIIRGLAGDFGGGRVASVEVSFNLGRSWHVAHGREKWFFRLDLTEHLHLNLHRGATHHRTSQHKHHSMSPAAVNTSSTSTVPLLVNHTAIRTEDKDENVHIEYLTIWSRAVDDSGWLEDLCAPASELSESGNGQLQQGRTRALGHNVLRIGFVHTA